MIEIIYDEENAKAEAGGREKYELPRNIRQVGNAPGNFKIYIEDYVMTYLRKIAAPGNMNCRGAILLGKVYEEKNGRVMFISGAVDAQNLEFDISLIKFGDSVWSGLYTEINKYFDNLSVVGWFLSRMGFTATINEQMKALHRENFPGNDKVLFLMDSLECEEAFYYYDGGSLVRERGYYIYYVRNEKMQNYIISRRNVTAEAGNDSVILKDRTVVENFRKKDEKKPEKENGHLGAAVASFVAVCAISLGMLWYVSPESIESWTDKIDGGTGGGVQVFMNSGETEAADAAVNEQTTQAGDIPDAATENVVPKNAVQESTVQESTAPKNTVQENTVTENAAPESTMPENTTETPSEKMTEAVSEAAAESASAEAGNAENIYTVETGDTLVSISIRMYGSQNYADKIAEANGISVDEPIYEGEKLVIPYID